MKGDCHVHMVLDGLDWKASIGRHRDAVDTSVVRRALERYREAGYTYLRDGGDRWGVGAAARAVAPEHGIRLVTPLGPLCKEGHYGKFIGDCFADLREFARLVQNRRQQGADFIKIMISGLMDFDRFGVLSEEGLPPEEIREMIHIAHEEGFSVMAHANGARVLEAAAVAGVDSVEHGAYPDETALQAMAENRVIWVPTVSTVGNLRGKGRFQETAVAAILESFLENVHRYHQLGGMVAPGTDAGAWAVPHGCCTEEAYLIRAGIPADAILQATQGIIDRF